ncbi:MAG TPA: endonuclease III domain-containing protein [Pirellulales bacterium]|nr:endonuclease III domain-containing protein [Pirellulales bacterium]
MNSQLEIAFEQLTSHYGRRMRAAAPDSFVALICSILDEACDRPRAVEVLENLSAAGVIDVRALSDASRDELSEWMAPAGNAQKRAERLRRLAAFVVDRYEGDVDAMLAADAESLREELLAIRGVGAETADSVLLYAAGRPSFVVELAAHRVLKRHGWVEFDADNATIKENVESSLARDPARLAEFHDLLQIVGREHCRKAPVCEGCPLAELLPECGPLAPEF